jgi:hypothetical protein
MKKYDRNNLDFLMSADRSTFNDWFKTASQDDIDYAFELLNQYSLELDAKSEELKIEAELALMGDRYPKVLSLLKKVSK